MTTVKASFLIIGGGAAGCVLASRLSEDPDRHVVLVEAGEDHDGEERRDLTETYGGKAFMDSRYYWPGLTARQAAAPPAAPDPGKVGYRQARLLGGGSSINGQIALRAAPSDYDAWQAMGAAGWGWHDVLPVFKALESDLDFQGEDHGTSGPIRIRRSQEAEWDVATRAMMKAWEAMGSPFLADLNSTFGDGYGPLPFSNDGVSRHSTSRAYLTPAVRARPNLEILTGAHATRIVTENGRAVGAEVLREGEPVLLSADRVIVSAGALHSPQILMLSGIGDGAALAKLGLATVAHRPGVGRNLHDHPIVSVSGYTVPSRRRVKPGRAVLAYRRYTSGIEGCEPSDMVMSAGARSMWHAIGERICSLRAYIALPYSRGALTLATPDPLDPPEIDFNGLSDERDMKRIVQGFRAIARIMLQDLRPDVVSDVFPARLSRRIERMSLPTALNDWIARAGAVVMDASPRLRSVLIQRVITNGESLAEILSNETLCTDYVRSILGTSWHPCGTCRIGSASDPLAVVTPDGAVIGVPNLYVADASVMPRIPRTNTNLPTIMIAEKLAKSLASAD